MKSLYHNLTNFVIGQIAEGAGPVSLIEWLVRSWIRCTVSSLLVLSCSLASHVGLQLVIIFIVGQSINYFLN